MQSAAAWWDVLRLKGHAFMERNETKLSLMHTVALWGNVAVTIATLCILVWKGGMMAERQDANTKDIASQSGRIDRLESQGSGGLRAHVDMDDTRIKGLADRLNKAEDAIMSLSVIRTDVAEIKTSVEFLTGKRTIPKP